MEFKEKQSIYLQIGDHICENILAGIWSEGEKIPSTRELAAEIEVNPNTVVRTFSYLEDMGVILKKRGIGYFVTETAEGIILKKKKKNFIKLQLPNIFKTMDLLKISRADLERLHEEYEKK